MIRKLAFPTAVVAALASLVAPPVEGAYVADFSTTGASAHFAVMNNGVADTTVNGIAINPGDGPGGADDYLDLFATAASSSGTQMRFNVAPSNFEGAEVAIPTGATSTSPRTEARVTVTIREITGGNDLPAENPYTQFGFAEFDPEPNTAVYSSKVVVQVHSMLNQVLLGYTANRATPSTTLSTFPIPGGSFTAGDTLELQVTNDQARVLYNGTALAMGGPGTDYATLPANFFATNFNPGDALIPFFGIFRGVELEAGDTLIAGFDNVNARNVVVDSGAGAGDLDFDGDVDGTDFLVFQRGLGSMYDAIDLADFKANFGTTNSVAATMTIPEPASAGWFIAATALGTAGRRAAGLRAVQLAKTV